MSWDYYKQQIKDGKINYGNGQSSVPGNFIIEATLPAMGMPLGFLWYRWNCRREIEIAYIWVHEDVRRAGLATLLFQRLVSSHGAECPTIITGQCNEMSAPWARKNGFVQSEGGFWLREVPRVLAEPTSAKKRKKRASKKSRTVGQFSPLTCECTTV